MADIIENCYATSGTQVVPSLIKKDDHTLTFDLFTRGEQKVCALEL